MCAATQIHTKRILIEKWDSQITIRRGFFFNGKLAINFWDAICTWCSIACAFSRGIFHEVNRPLQCRCAIANRAHKLTAAECANTANYCGKHDLWNDIFIVWIESPHSTGLRCHASHVKWKIFSARRTSKKLWIEFNNNGVFWIVYCLSIDTTWIRFGFFFVVQNSWNAIVKPATREYLTRSSAFSDIKSPNFKTKENFNSVVSNQIEIPAA